MNRSLSVFGQFDLVACASVICLEAASPWTGDMWSRFEHSPQPEAEPPPSSQTDPWVRNVIVCCCKPVVVARISQRKSDWYNTPTFSHQSRTCPRFLLLVIGDLLSITEEQGRRAKKQTEPRSGPTLVTQSSQALLYRLNVVPVYLLLFLLDAPQCRIPIILVRGG